MDLGCFDMGCISVSDKQDADRCPDSEEKEGTPLPVEIKKSASKSGKNKLLKETRQSITALNRFTSQIKKKPSHRKTSPINWFPRKKVDSYLERKIKMLQERDGMNLSLDQTLDDANPHYSRVLREKMAAREAAHWAMEARKAALVEASWSRILKAARIQSKEAESLLQTAEKNAAEAFEAAIAVGVIMYDTPNCPRQSTKIQASSVNGGGSTTHTVTASFETAFEVDREVAAAVKSAFVRLANCPSFSKDEFRDLLQKISQNPDTGENNQESKEFSLEYDSESGSDFETASQKNATSSLDLYPSKPHDGTRQRKNKRRQSLEKLTMAKLVDMMVERLKRLQEEELSSLATIVATCGLNAALAEIENSKDPGGAAGFSNASAVSISRRMSSSGGAAGFSNASAVSISRRMSSAGAGSTKNYDYQSFIDAQARKNQAAELPSLDKFLVKHKSKLEIEVEKAKSRKKLGNETVGRACLTGEVSSENTGTSNHSSETDCGNAGVNAPSSGSVPDFGSMLIKHSSKLEKEIKEMKKNRGKEYEATLKGKNGFLGLAKDVSEVLSLDKVLVKHVSRLEREVEQAKNRRQNSSVEGCEMTSSEKESEEVNVNSVPDCKSIVKENLDVGNIAGVNAPSSESVPDFGSMLIKHSSKLEKEIEEMKKNRGKEYEATLKGKNGVLGLAKDVSEVPSLDKVLVKRVSRLEREVEEARNRRQNHLVGGCEMTSSEKESEEVDVNSVPHCTSIGKENLDVSNIAREETGESLDKILVKPLHRLEREKLQALSSGSNYEYQKHQKKQHGHNLDDCESLDKVLVKHVSRLEKEKMRTKSEEGFSVKTRSDAHLPVNAEGGLHEISVKHISRLEREKIAAATQQEQNNGHVARREARERELHEAWGGLSLGNSMKLHLSKLEREKAAWTKAEEEERKRALQES
ncbi:hypothetical protein BT93_I1563 [Corymbia citriodora subsp. variegata]|nr:hypothetical protein BT93_I1563 [Corymbia citriodora subsp. variegata]